MSAWVLAASFYFGAGLLLALSSYVHGVFARGKRLRAFALAVLFWPLLVLVAPESFFHDRVDTGPPEDFLKNALAGIVVHDIPLSDEELLHLSRVADAGLSGVTYFAGAGQDPLIQFWESRVPPAAYRALRSARAALCEPEPDSGIRFSLRAPDWYVGFSNEFLKTVSGVDRKLQGRILEAIARISENPNTPVGDTIKPLSADLAGLWRVRIGDERLVYYPDSESKQITLISFGPRGRIYNKLPDASSLTG